VLFTDVVELSGDPALDVALFAEVLKGRQGRRPPHAGPIRLKPESPQPAAKDGDPR
jgi:hypothetical protein